MPACSPVRRWLRLKTGAFVLSRASGKTRSSIGCTKSSLGASLVNCGGATKSRLGTDRTERSSSPRPKRKRSARQPPNTVCAVPLRRDEDVLDTWFSSALWPFSTLGWPEPTRELARYYPTDVLVTGFDIIFFWVARMMMMGLHFMGDVPFRTVYIHALVRDGQGQKMSKSRGNIIDPLELIDRYGCDALRFTLAALAAPGRDIKLAESRVEGYRNFATKLWNAARYAEMNGCALVAGFTPHNAGSPSTGGSSQQSPTAPPLSRQHSTPIVSTRPRTACISSCGERFCDWYVEFTKPILQGDEVAARTETQATTAWVLGRIVHLLHPIMPFITEEVWQNLAGDEAGLLLTSSWPEISSETHDPAASAEMEWVVEGDLGAPCVAR